MIDEAQMIEAARNSLFLPTLPGRYDALDIPGIQGRYGYGVQGGFVNRVGAANLAAEQADATIQAVINHFDTLKQTFAWFVTCTDTPGDLEERLERAGFERALDFSGMVLPEIHDGFPMHPRVTVRPARTDERQHVSRIYQAGLAPDKAAADLFADMMETPTMTHYLAYLDGVDEPIGATASFYIEDHRTVVLEASLILEPYRGNGFYKSLVAQRLHDAYRDGMRVAVVQAFVKTSAPKLRKLGFVEKCAMRTWRWSPDGMRTGTPTIG